MEYLIFNSIVILASLYFFIESVSIVFFIFNVVVYFFKNNIEEITFTMDLKMRIEFVFYILSAVIFFTGGK